jgi:Uma2 family endonuclease
MDSLRLLTADEFTTLGEAEDDFEPRWNELLAGRVVTFQPPPPEHGAVVLNFAKAIAAYLQKATDEKGYAGFETGLLVAHNPDTVRRPPISFFVTGDRFAEVDSRLTETRPALVLEIASTNDRRRAMRDRVESYLAWGVRSVWVADSIEKSVHILQSGRPPRIFSGAQSISGSPIFADFRMSTTELFALPE